MYRHFPGLLGPSWRLEVSGYLAESIVTSLNCLDYQGQVKAVMVSNLTLRGRPCVCCMSVGVVACLQRSVDKAAIGQVPNRNCICCIL